MRKTLLVFLTILSMATMLSGCFYYPYPYRDDSYGRGNGYDRGYYGGRGYDSPHDGHHDYYR